MSESCKIVVERRGDIAIFWTDGYINNQGGEETPTIDKTFRIMGLAQYTAIYPTQEQALQAVAAAG